MKRSSKLEISEKTRLIANEKLKCEYLTQENISTKNELAKVGKDLNQVKQNLAEEKARHVETKLSLVEAGCKILFLPLYSLDLNPFKIF
ncbi:hypothetical protein [Candidatus Protochlamydia sp. W-9]|uniref:hypothetical protein n=1 Tax=Candidatus Protochlamydia sp. W-9 TaxID=1785087 RepID=UPI00096A34FD|nr:hypothetical protein [Candidatus Protochlamydia sp. W-9]